MTHDYAHSATCRRLLALTFLGCLLTAVPALAQVQLENSVQKVVSRVDDGGNLKRELVPADSVVPGDELRYTIRFRNDGEEPVDAGSIVITNPIPENTEYLDGTAFGAGTDIEFSVDGETFAAADALRVQRDGAERSAQAADYTAVRWTFKPQLAAGATGSVSFNVRLR